jgi:hypothetical protein
MYSRERQYLSKFPDEMIKIATESATNVYLSPDKNKIVYVATAAAVIPENISPAPPATNSQPEERQLTPGNLYIYDREEDKNFLISSAQIASSSAQKVLLATDLFDKDPKNFDASPSSFQKLQATVSAQTAKNFASYYSSLYSTGIQWFPDSKHVLFTEGDTIYLAEYDNTNKTAVYVGPLLSNFIYPWPDGSKVIILTSFSANSPANLYAVELK